MHSKTVCKICDKLITQCGCCNKTTIYVVCEKCKDKQIKLIEEALKDNSKGLLTDAVFAFVVYNIIHGLGKIIEEERI